MVDLQLKFDQLNKLDNKQVSDTIAERERAKQRSLQQRLEQLVAVHRQLLRKFGSLELEAAELKKKTALRDERIRQLENNSRGLIGNIRQQSERYLSELATLREQIQVSLVLTFMTLITCSLR
jgi:kinesin family protein 5